MFPTVSKSCSTPEPVNAEIGQTSAAHPLSLNCAIGTSEILSILFGTSIVGNLASANLVQHLLDDPNLFLVKRIGQIHQVQQQIGAADFFERALERFDQGMGNLVDKTDGIDDHHFIAAGQTQRARGRVKRRKQFVFDKHAGARERVHQSRFARVGISDQRHGRETALHGAPCVAAPRVRSTVLKPMLEMADALANAPSIDFQLRLAGTAGADTAAEPRQMGPLARQARQQIFELRQLDLQLALVAARALGEDIENQLTAIDDADFERRLPNCAAAPA